MYTDTNEVIRTIERGLAMAKENGGKRNISFINWLITLIFSIIPGVNLIFFIVTMALARNPAKRSYAIAAFTLTLVILIALCVAVIFFGDDIAKWLTDILDQATPSEAV